MKNKKKVIFLFSAFLIIMGSYIGISIHIIIQKTDKIQLLNQEIHGFDLKVQELKQQIKSLKKKPLKIIPPHLHEDNENILEDTEILSNELEDARLKFINSQKYIPDSKPTSNFIITKPYLPSRNHYGIDLAGKKGDPIYASAAGVVKKIEEDNEIYGKTVYIDHLNGYSSFYGHNEKILVNKNNFINKGELIALLGNTGRSTAPHLHFEIKYNNKNIDPESILK